MSKHGGGLIAYRILHEYRKVFSIGGTLRRRAAFLLYVLLTPASAAIAWALNARILSAVRSHIRADGDNPWPALAVGSALAGLLFFSVSLIELMREIAFAGDREMVQISATSPERALRYRLVMAVFRFLPFSVVFALFPAQFLLSFPLPRPWAAFVIPAVVLYFLWLFMLALFTVMSVLSVSLRLRVRRHTVFMLLYVLVVLLSIPVSSAIVDQELWPVLVHRLRHMSPGTWVLGALFFAFLVSTRFLYRRSLELWHEASKSEEPVGRLGRTYRGRHTCFPADAARALLQKDMRDLIRNPAYRQALVACGILLILAAWSQWKAAGTTGSWRCMMTCLSFLYLIPLFFSGRSIALELPMLDFYRLVLPKVETLMDLKLKTHTTVNCLTVVALSVPVFLLTAQGGNHCDFFYFILTVGLFVPLLSMLVISLGTFFPHISPVPHPFGIKLKGIVLYGLLALPLYSFLLNRMYVGTAVYSAALVPLTLLLYCRAKRSIRGETSFNES